MALNVGDRLGPYEISGAIGSGGMGEVYRARDAKLGRDVAIKILPRVFAADPERRARFEREARVLAALNHPNIAAIYGVEELSQSGSVDAPALVLELVDGPTLAERIASGQPLPLADALTIARQIADGLGAAHERGIVHRDLKPANIKLTPAGLVKVLDFGLAKLADQSGVAAHLSMSPTTLVSMPGVLLGTAAYMAPEQAKGETVDQLADIWSFGCVLYEMLTGRRAFAGASTSEVISEILKAEPDWEEIPAETPESIRRLLRRCLRKDRRLRLHHIADAVIEIEDGQTGASPVVPTGATRPTWPIWTLSVALVVAAGVAVASWMSRRAPEASELRLDIATEPTSDPLSLAVSPDGKAIVFAATVDGRSRLWLRSMSAAAPRPLPSTEGAYSPFWSPDGRSLGFFADGKLKRLDIETGSTQTLATATAGRGGAWNAEGVIVFAPQAGPLYRIPASGGEPSRLDELEREKGSKRFPQFLPDGRHFIYLVRDQAVGAKGIYVSQLDGSGAQHLIDADTSGIYATSGHLLFTREGTLLAQKFDPVRLQVSGAAVPLAAGVAANAGVGIAAVSSAGGVIAYRSGSPGGERRLTWFDRSGREVEGAPSPDRVSDWGPSVSPDGRHVALSRTVDRNEDVWILDTDRGVPRRVTFNAARDVGAIWSPDGADIVFVATRGDRSALFRKAADGSGSEERLPGSDGASMPSDWSSDGRFILYRRQDARTLYDIWALPLGGDRPSTGSGRPEPVEGRKAFPVLQATFNERDAQFSPDGKWIAYESDESGRFEVYVRPFPGPGAATPVSTGGGAQVRWSHDGAEIFDIALDDRLMAAPIRVDSSRQTVVAGPAHALFPTQLGGAVTVSRQQYAVARDDQRFLMNVDAPHASAISIVLNWRGR